MKKLLLLFVLPLLFAGCKGKKTKLTDDETVGITDFVDAFPDIKLPYFVADSTMKQKLSDSAVIGNKIFAQFVPDSVLSKDFGTAKPKIYPLGKVQMKKSDTYLFVRAATTAKNAAYLMALDKDNKFIASIPLLIADRSNAGVTMSGGMDSKYVVSKTLQRKASAEQYNEEKTAYILNSEAREFSVIMSDISVEEGDQDIINPIDTLATEHKFSGDYTKDKRNIISIRDGRSEGRIAFFVHFEKENGECTGELKGEAEIRSAKTAVFRASGNPCELEFTFDANRVTMKELAACGSYRDIRCFFDGSYSRKKELKPKKK
jgi:hypothetical protein